MSKINKKLKLGVLILGLALYLTLIFASFSTADPTGGDVTFISSSNYSVPPEARSDRGGTITTITLDAVQQENSWKGYVGNITGSLVLRNADGWSIYEWVTNNSVLTGNVFVTRNDSIIWANTKCANATIINSEQTFFGMTTSNPYSINKTFNYSTHQQMNISSVGTIAANSCPCTATYVNGSAQTIDVNTSFQEILLYDDTYLIFATFIDQDSWGYSNNDSAGGANVTYDFQLIVAENRSGITGTQYFFYADIS